MILSIAAAILSCGLTAAPDGTPAPQDSVAMLNAPIPNELATSLATRVAPRPTMSFVGEPNAEPEWIMGLKKESESKFMIARLSEGLLAYGIRIGWVDVQEDGSNTFTETSKGTCQVKEAERTPQESAQ